MAATAARSGVRAQAKFIRMSPTKVRAVLNLVRGEYINRAAEILRFSDRAASDAVMKVLQSAVANAIENNGMDPAELYISECYADEGPVLRRFRPRARGRATRIDKKTSHITVVVDRLSDEELELRTAREAARGVAPDAAAARRRRVARSRGEDPEAAEASEELVDEVVEEITDDVPAEELTEVAEEVADEPTDEVAEAADAVATEDAEDSDEDDPDAEESKD